MLPRGRRAGGPSLGRPTRLVQEETNSEDGKYDEEAGLSGSDRSDDVSVRAESDEDATASAGEEFEGEEGSAAEDTGGEDDEGSAEEEGYSGSDYSGQGGDGDRSEGRSGAGGSEGSRKRSDHGLSLQRRSVVPDGGSDYDDGYSSEGRDSYISEGRDGYNSEGRGGYILDGTSICERGKGGSAAATEMPEEGEPIEGGALAVFYRATVVIYFVLAPTYFWYRWLYTIEWDVPYRMYYQESQATICVAEMFGSICVMMLAVIRFPQPWAYNQRPPQVVLGAVLPRYQVHILVPCYNEPSDIVLATCHAALQLRHPWAKVRVYLLDDGRNLEREKTVTLMGDPRFVYVARPKFPGLPVHGKAGNLNHTLKFVIFASQPPTDTDVVVVFDADMKAHTNFLHHVLPYLEEDPRTALVQTPQHFFNVDHTGDVFNHQNCTFFFGVQTGLDAWRATVCCGTNFAVRASALAAVGWFPTESITEDFLLSLKVTASGWHCRYHGHVLVTGEAPEDLRQIFKQRSRWCTGCFQVFFQVETFMWVRQLPAIQMLCYFNSIMGYLSTIICFPVFTVVPIVSVYTKTHPVKELTTLLTVLWAGYFLSMVVVIEMMPRNFSRFSGFLGSKVNYIMWWCFLKGMWKAVRGRLGLRKIVFKVTEKKGDGSKKREAVVEKKKAKSARSDQDGLLDGEEQKGPSGYTDAEVALMYGLVDEDGEYDEDAVQALQEELAEAEAAANEEKRDSTKHDMKFHWLVFVASFIVAVAGGVSKTLDTLQWGWDNTVLANVSVAWVVINMVPFGMALGYAYLPHTRTVHMLLVSISWTVYAAGVLFAFAAMVTKVLYGNPKFM